ncbi:MAG TPA: glycosyltransferase family 2 protein [Burkholderiales bacterium]|nr:glycosyltransferase family 2 protein [Burkholderiales bacterium]
MIRISVVTVVLNAARHLEHCLRSVAEQGRSDVEHLVVDGGSTDGSVDIIRAHAHRLAWWISEPDAGIGDAMNKGLRHARGDWLLFLHADDFLHASDALARVESLLDETSDIVACGISWQGDVPGTIRRPRGFGPWFNFKTGIYHQGALIHRRLFGRVGVYDVSFKIAVDYEFFLRTYRARAALKLVPDMCLATMRSTGVSSRRDWPSVAARLAEERRAHRMHARGIVLSLAYALYWPLYLPYARARIFLTAG